MHLRILGCGTSSGVPKIGNDWGACDPVDARNRRTRVSILVRMGGATILVDTGPDLREQLLAAEVSRVDAVVWTHDHADHCHGLDDLRAIYHKTGPIQGYARRETLDSLRARFAYAFAGGQGYPALIDGHLLPDWTEFGGGLLRVVDQPHGRITTAGLIFEADGAKLVYATDLNMMTADMRAAYEGADLLVIDCLRRRAHPTHPNLEQALKWIGELGVQSALLTHMDNSMDYRKLCAELPPSVRPAYDGLEVELGRAG